METTQPTNVSASCRRFKNGLKHRLPLAVWVSFCLSVPFVAAPLVAQPASDEPKAISDKPERAHKGITNSIGMKLNLIPAGEFMMGSPKSETSHKDSERRHRVVITKPYYLGVHEVTQSQYEQVMGKNPSCFSKTGSGKKQVAGLDTSMFPVETVSWQDAMEFCRKLSAKEGRTYRLPTEAQWEYAARAGTTTPFSFGAVLNGREANCHGKYPYGTKTKGPFLDRTTTVGSYGANAFGLYDMSGNVWELCSDWYAGDYYDKSPVKDPTGPKSGARRVGRGGCCRSCSDRCRSADRDDFTPDSGYYGLGFRVVMVPSK